MPRLGVRCATKENRNIRVTEASPSFQNKSGNSNSDTIKSISNTNARGEKVLLNIYNEYSYGKAVDSIPEGTVSHFNIIRKFPILDFHGVTATSDNPEQTPMVAHIAHGSPAERTGLHVRNFIFSITDN